MSSKLEELREKVDEADRGIIASLETRMQLVDEIGMYKKAHGMSLFDHERLQDMLRTRADWGAAKKLSVNFIHDIFALIHKESVTRQERS